MTTPSMLQQAGKPILRAFKFVWIPSDWIEYLYYFVFSYSILASFLGIEIPLVAAGLTVALGALCLTKMGRRRKEIYAPIALLLACAISFILVQIVIYDASLMDDFIRSFILWIFGLIIMQSLCLRPGFLRRCTIVIFTVGSIVVPQLGFNMDTVERAAATIEIGGGLRNPNGLGIWFGFCVVVFGISALETKRGVVVPILYALAAVGSLFIVGLTVSRGAMLGCAIALTVGFRRFLKRGFVPVLVLFVVAGVVLESGVIDQVISNYEERGTQETGRFLVWPVIIERFLASPIFGVGYSKIASYIPVENRTILPHNSFLFFALSSGIVPFALYLAFWIRAARSSFSDVAASEYSLFRIPLLLYALVAFILADISTEPWSLLALTVGAGSGIFHGRGRVIVTHGKIPRRRIAPSVRLPSQAGTMQ